MGDDDFDLFHAGHYRGMTSEVINGFIARDHWIGCVALNGGLALATGC